MSDFPWGIVLVLLAVLGLLLGVGYVLYLGTIETPEQKQILYQAWLKVNPSVENLTIDEWTALRSKNLLPGQVKDNSASNMAVGMAVGMGAGAMMAR